MRWWCFLALFLLLIGFVSAQVNTCSSPNDVILRLSSATNAHGETFSTTGTYTVDVCYSQIFGNPYTGSNPHTCISGNANRVLRLSSPSNAHGEIPDASSPAYNTNVCYGNLVCHSVAGNTNCASGEQEIVSLSGQSNAHIETASANAYSSSSNRKICCSNTPTTPPTTPSITNVGWNYYNLLPPPIAANTLFCPNSAIYAFAITNGVSDGTPLTFNFYDWDILSNDFIFGPVSTTVQNNLALFPVNFADTNVQNLLTSFLDGPNNDVELMFNAGISGDSEGSYIVSYVKNTALCSYEPPTATITAPVHQGVYFANTQINFVGNCNSRAGPLSYSWSIVQNEETITKTYPTFSQTFTQGGQATVTLTCTDLQGLSATAQSQILIVASPFAFVYINDPAWNGVEYETPVVGQPYFPKQVSFDASDSFAVDTTGACAVNCLGGNCPQRTQNSPSACIGNVPGNPTNGQTGGALLISNAPSTPSSAVWNDMSFDWKFWDGNWDEPWTSNEGSGTVSGFLEYDDVSNAINDKHMSLSIQVTSGSSPTSASFQRDFTLGRCLNNGNSILLNGVLNPTNQNDMCLGGDQLPNTRDECCPTGQVCVDQDGDSAGTNYPFNCQFLDNPITKCEDFQDENSCNGNTNQAYPLASYGNQAIPACTFIQCHWKNNADGCGVRATQYLPTSNGQCTPNSCILSSCTWNTQQSECINGRKTISYTVTSNNNPNPCPGSPASCDRPVITIPCGSLNFELDFFGVAQFITTILIIGLFYAMFARNFKEK
jgi:hypothetical protein